MTFTKEQVLEALRDENPRAPAGHLQMYADAYLEYAKAQANIDEHGPVVFHPRTGAPIDNPYLKIRNGAAAALQKLPLKSDRLWQGVKR
jgi:phage terminase small subunit